MKVIKTPKADLEKKRFRFFKVGLIVACSLTLLAFRWTTYELDAEETSKIRLINFTELEPELPKIFKRQEQQVVKLEVDKRFFKPAEDDLVKTSTEPVDTKLPLTLTLEPIDCPDCPEDPDPVDIVLPQGPLDWAKLQRTPYFDECASPSDRKAEADCTYAEIRNFVQRNTKYPSNCREIGIQGTVWVSFVINKKGEISEVEVLRAPHKELGEAAIKGVSKLPKMNPGLQRLNPVDVKLQIPVKFKLQ